VKSLREDPGAFHFGLNFFIEYYHLFYCKLPSVSFRLIYIKRFFSFSLWLCDSV